MDRNPTYEATTKERVRMIDRSIPCPKNEGKLFEGDVDWQVNAYLNLSLDQWSMYADGYKRAADLLVEHVMNTHSNQNALIFPVVFLYRQYIELRLKELIKNGNLLLDFHEKLPRHHKIDRLWRQCRGIIERIWPAEGIKELNEIEALIQQFSRTDPYSMAFRYPTDKDGNPSVPDLRHISFIKLSEIMTGMASLLDGASMGISNGLDDKWEMKVKGLL